MTRTYSAYLPGMFVCADCGVEIGISSEVFDRFFEARGRLVCGGCGKPVNMWDIVVRVLRDDWNLLGGTGPSLVEGQVTMIPVTLEPDGLAEVRFEQHGVPTDARILSVNYTGHADAPWPLELHGNQPIRHAYPRAVTLYGRPMPGRSGPGKVNIAVAWVSAKLLPYSWDGFVEAIEVYSFGHYDKVIVPANVAVETALGKLLTDFLTAAVSSKRVDDFLSNAATYSHQLNVLLPALTARLDIAPLDEPAKGMLNRLRSLRNDLAHLGKLDAPLNRNHAAECVCAAFFGLHYIRYVTPRLIAGK